MKRIKFEKGKQKEFFNLVKDRLKINSVRAIRQYGIEISYSTLKSYYSGRLSLPKTLFDNLCYLAKINHKEIEYESRNPNWGQKIGGRNGIKEVFRKYPHRLNGWRKKGQKNSPIFNEESNLKSIKIPKLNEKLAEFVGIYLGDGTITPYQLRIAGDYRYDLPYFDYISKMIYELFGLRAVIQRVNNLNTMVLTISSKNLCTYFNKELGIAYGSKIKNKTVIPKEIIAKSKLALACLRGLIDTDGSISRRGRGGSQFCIQFTSHNPPLLDQVFDIGKGAGVFSYRDNAGAGTNKWGNIVNYFKVVGSSNLRHIVRFYERFENKNTIYQKDIIKYYRKSLYNAIDLPFKLGPVV
ncbi:hypothetical protein COU61_02105 [Candidatus Pacearchaeota archaeon CG10_big_fil_rev_8_21_14_0_10_35_13]|nr:MAG: hypothetical protein COU61_02105 [Candidatus Pacearchaeota archaeon CG10_big_fil_rev_8_21_14_0_10_35_13]